MNKRIYVAAMAILVLTLVNAEKASAQSCPNVATYGSHSSGPMDRTLQSRIEVTYFNTNDPNAFISEAGGFSRSGSYTRMSSGQFVAKIQRLVGEGVANVKKQQSANPYLGQTAEMNLERNGGNAQIIKTGMSVMDPSYLSGLDRETEITVSKGSSLDGGYYRLSVLSWFVNVTPRGGHKAVDYDASILLKPGETAVFKLMSDDEAKRSGAARSYIAVTMRSVDNSSIAMLNRSQTRIASR
ncbi:MAG: hypothetical protein ABI596_03900 [Pyrinomonadaceae bacterium]